MKTPNPVEVCIAPQSVDANGKTISCFSSEENIKSTCFDENNNMLYVRSRLQDLARPFLDDRYIRTIKGALRI